VFINENNFALNFSDFKSFKEGKYDLYFNKIYGAQNFNRKPGYIIYGISVDVSGSINIKKILD
jgi:hypothetical protein